MTAPNGAIVFNNSTGSDTTASGMGSANVYGAGASITSASAVVTGINTTGVAAGDLLWVQSSTGRQFSIIASVDSGTQVTCDNNFDVTESSRTWAIGGKRATLDNTDSRKMWLDILSVYAAEAKLETDQTLTSAISATAQNQGGGGYLSSADGTIKTITQSGNDSHFKGGGSTLYLKNIKLDASGTPTTAIFVWDNGVGSLPVYAQNCIFGDPTNTCHNLFYGGGSYQSTIQCYGCTIQNMTNSYAFQNGTVRSIFVDCMFRNNIYAVGFPGSSSGPSADLIKCIFVNNTHGVSVGRMSGTAISNCIFANNTTAIYFWITAPMRADNNLFVNNTTAIDNQHNADQLGASRVFYFNYFYNNTTKYSNQYDSGKFGDIDLTADPFVDAANGDFNLNATNGGGGTLRSTNYTLGG